MSHLNEYRGHALVTNTSLGIGAAIASRLLYDDRHVTRIAGLTICSMQMPYAVLWWP
jgi:hypothetical protein